MKFYSILFIVYTVLLATSQVVGATEVSPSRTVTVHNICVSGELPTKAEYFKCMTKLTKRLASWRAGARKAGPTHNVCRADVNHHRIPHWDKESNALFAACLTL